MIKHEVASHSLSSDLGSLINDEKSSDLILEAGERKFKVHRNILAARSPVFANLLAQLEDEISEKDDNKDVIKANSINRKVKDVKDQSHLDIRREETKNKETEDKILQYEKNEEACEGGLKDTSSLDEKEERPMKKLVITDLPS